MYFIQSVEKLKILIKANNNIAFVPTMGNLHNGHLSLVEKAKSLSGDVLVSIFINPSQFNSQEDFNAYPKTLSQDILLLEPFFDDRFIVFSPKEDEILSHKTGTQYNLPEVADDLCGKYRPGHFDGVIQIIDIFFDLIKPRYSVFGKKDYQQLFLIKDFAKIKYPNIKIISQDTIRSSESLALSSRNGLLGLKHLSQATELNFALQELVEMVKLNSDHENAALKIKSLLNKSGWEVEYVAIRRRFDLKEATGADKLLVALVAARLNNVRLIDNIEFCID
ncbi:pantoate--beta-alanine ligase [Methylophilales bacterium HTCC2181]|uniref:Pantothenate synthetase n=1 Tax=Methylophilales bacterium HTCC2181 TaxID=383631 RepID=A0P5T9_9PROT|nr:pantoate--beta-alanine ligase [Methylophilales bacterium HTCC2181]